MGRRKDALDQEALREKLIAIGEALVVEGGPTALTARALATHIGYSVGHIYNLVADLEDLTLLINARTLDRLYQSLTDAAGAAPKGPARLHALAQAYLKFCAHNAKLWALVMGHRLAEGKDLPDDYAARIAALPQLVGAEIKALLPRRNPEQLRRDIATLWAALQGLSTLDMGGRLPLIGAPEGSVLATHLIETYLTAQTAKAKA